MRTLLVALTALFSVGALADPVVIRTGMNTNGPISELSTFLEKARAMAADINAESNTTAELWVDAFHGANPGASLILTYDSIAAWAADSAVFEANPQWQQLMQTFPAENFPARFRGLSNVVWRSDGYQPTQPGNVMVIFGFQINEGGAVALAEFAKKADAIAQQLGIESDVLVITPIAAGDNTGSVTVTVRYADAAGWAAATAKQAASSEWREMMATFPTSYTLGYQGMSVAAQ